MDTDANQASQGQSQLQLLDADTVTSRIIDALKIVHHPYSANDQRQQAMRFLEEVKSLEQAPLHGYTLAARPGAEPVVRHFGLSLLESTIKNRWSKYPREQHNSFREWILELAERVSVNDPFYLRNKIAQLWVEMAKRTWAHTWMNMDQQLVQLWEVPDSLAHKELVLSILEMLSEEVFNSDDPIVALRDGILSKSCLEIFHPLAVLFQAFPKRAQPPAVRYGEEGWIARITTLLNQCLENDVQGNEGIRSCAIKSLTVLYSMMPWVVPKALIACNIVLALCNGLAASHVAVQKAALEAIHALYSRTSFTPDEFEELVIPLYEGQFLDLCTRLFEWSRVNADDIDDDKYQFSKKFSELLACLANYMDRRYHYLPKTLDPTAFLELLLLVVQSPSLVVSIPVLVTWTRLLSSEKLGRRIAKTSVIGPLLEVCSARQLRYESLPEDTDDPTCLFLLEDTDTIPERHAFLGNYRRYSAQIIEAIVQLKLTDAMTHIIGQTENILDHLYDGQSPFSTANYSKTSLPVLRVDAQCTVLECALKGFVKLRLDLQASSKSAEERTRLESELETWCTRLLDMQFEDPAIRKRVLQLLVTFSTTVLDKKTGFMFKVLEHILMTWPTAQPEHKMYNDAIKDLQTESLVELQRLASKMPDHLLDVYDQLEAKIKDIASSGNLDEKRQLAYQSFLFIIIHRSTRLDVATKIERLRGFVEPVQSMWRDESLQQAVSSFDAFSQLLGLDKAQRYMVSHGMQDIKDWGAQALDDEGLALQAEMDDRQAQLPLRATKTFLTYSVEKVDKNSEKFATSVALWKDSFPVILRHLLQFLAHAHAAHNPANWTGIPGDPRPVVARVLTDRFWQAGISEGSKDDFYSRVMDKKGTLEGLASTIRGTVRSVRETCYAIIYCMTRLDREFYGFNELPAPLAHALFADSFCLSSHQLINLINLMRYLVDNCPVELREQFLPPVLSTGFRQIDAKVNSEWESLHARQEVQTSSDGLTEEMKAESILRQLTYSAVIMVADFLDPSKPNPKPSPSEAPSDQRYPSLRKFCLMQSSIVEPLLVFCTHAIRMRDTRCCSVILRVLRSVVGDFHVDSSNAPPQNTVPANGAATGTNSNGGAPPSELTDMTPIPVELAAPIREYISSNVLKASITSLHEGYFVDLQKELAQLIAAILVYYSEQTSTPRDVLLSLPNMKAEEVEKTMANIMRPGLHSRHQRGIVLELMKDLKGVSVSEMGKVDRTPRPSKRQGRTRMVQEFMTAPPPVTRAPGATRTSPDGALDGVAGLFDQ